MWDALDLGYQSLGWEMILESSHRLRVEIDLIKEERTHTSKQVYVVNLTRKGVVLVRNDSGLPKR